MFKSKISKSRQTTLLEFFRVQHKKCYGYNSKTEEWHCIECGISMGRQNPRQLCGKWSCLYS